MATKVAIFFNTCVTNFGERTVTKINDVIVAKIGETLDMFIPVILQKIIIENGY